jgi:hypothetical protein
MLDTIFRSPCFLCKSFLFEYFLAFDRIIRGATSEKGIVGIWLYCSYCSFGQVGFGILQCNSRVPFHGVQAHGRE